MALAPARYILRFDDICPGMNWTVWDRIEPLLIKYKVRPILAVVPDNRDPKLSIAAERSDFWAQVRHWQASGYCIAVHGYQHLYENRNSGIMNINSYSEFAGLSEAVQRQKLEKALAIFREHDVVPDCWVAPAHSFDEVTVRVLLELGVEVISDGFYSRPVRKLGAIWVPQQLWYFRPMPGGVWTVCQHFNNYKDAEVARLEQWLSTFAPNITSVADIVAGKNIRPVGVFDHLFRAAWLLSRRYKNWRWKKAA